MFASGGAGEVRAARGELGARGDMEGTSKMLAEDELRQLREGGTTVELVLSARQRRRVRGSLAVIVELSEAGELFVAHAPKRAEDLREALSTLSLPPEASRRADLLHNESAVFRAIASLVTTDAWPLSSVLANPRPEVYGLVQCLAASLLAGDGVDRRHGFYLRNTPHSTEARVLVRPGAALVFRMQHEAWGAAAPCFVILRL
jgi:hypothetical protein